MTLNWFDYLLAALCATYIILRFTRLRAIRIHWVASTLLVIVFLFPLPVMSLDIEYDQLPRSAKEGLHDNFEFLFLLMKFPMYWLALMLVWAVCSCIRPSTLNSSTHEAMEE